MKSITVAALSLLLIGPAAESWAQEVGYGNDALPSAEVLAFQKTDARLKYRNARIEHDARGCPVYEGVDRSGRVARAPLRDARGRRICRGRR